MVSTWHDGVIPYEFDPSIYVPKKMITLAMKRIENETKCIRFVQRNNKKQFVYITEGSRCSSYVGQRYHFCDAINESEDMRQHMFIDPSDFNMGIILHELCHVIGLYHEHQQPKRDDCIQVDFKNIVEGKQIHFLKQSPEDSSFIESERRFDYDSIMLYGESTFAKKGEVIISTKNKGRKLLPIDFKCLSKGDVIKIKELYGKYDQTRKENNSIKHEYLGRGVTDW